MACFSVCMFCFAPHWACDPVCPQLVGEEPDGVRHCRISSGSSSSSSSSAGGYGRICPVHHRPQKQRRLLEMGEPVGVHHCKHTRSSRRRSMTEGAMIPVEDDDVVSCHDCSVGHDVGFGVLSPHCGGSLWQSNNSGFRLTSGDRFLSTKVADEVWL